MNDIKKELKKIKITINNKKYDLFITERDLSLINCTEDILLTWLQNMILLKYERPKELSYLLKDIFVQRILKGVIKSDNI